MRGDEKTLEGWVAKHDAKLEMSDTCDFIARASLNGSVFGPPPGWDIVEVDATGASKGHFFVFHLRLVKRQTLGAAL